MSIKAINCRVKLVLLRCFIFQLSRTKRNKLYLKKKLKQNELTMRVKSKKMSMKIKQLKNKRA